MPAFLRLYSAGSPKDDIQLLLPVDLDLEQIEERLEQADPDEFVQVPFVFQNQIETRTLHLQLRKWGGWVVYRSDDTRDQ